MRVGLFLYMGLYCVWQVKSKEAPLSTVTEEASPQEVDDQIGWSGRDEEFLYPPPLVSPYGGTLKLVLGIAVPISKIGGRVLAFGQNFQFQFPIPQNATFFTKYFDDSVGGTRRRKRTTTTQLLHRPRDIIRRIDKTRSIFYKSLELAFERWGGNGRNCMMRTICEAAETPLKDEGLVGQLLHVMLTPDFGKGSGFDTSDDDYYHQAAEAGRSGNDCALTYPSCFEGRGLLDMVTKLDYV